MEFVTKIGDFLNELNESDLWKYIQNVVEKVKTLLDKKGEDDAKTLVEIIFRPY